MKSNKVEITKSQAAALELLLKDHKGDKDKIVDTFCNQGIEWESPYTRLIELTPSELARAIYFGYEIKTVEPGPKTYKLRAKIGVSVDLREDQIAKFMENQQRFVRLSLENGNAYLDGEAYFPEEIEDNAEFEKENGELGWGL